VAAADVRTVVVLYSEQADGRPSNELTDQSIRTAFAAGAPEQIQTRNEYLELSRFQGAEGRKALAEFLGKKYAGEKIDLVMAVLAPSLEFALEYRDQIFPGVPIVFMSVDQQEAQKHTLPADVIGVPVSSTRRPRSRWPSASIQKPDGSSSSRAARRSTSIGRE